MAATLSSTTLAAAVTSASATSLALTSVSGITAHETYLYIDREFMPVNRIVGTQVYVTRGSGGTAATTHASGTIVYFGPGNYFTTFERAGSATSADELVLPLINIKTGNVYSISNSLWNLQVPQTNINSVSDSNPVRINSRNYTQTSGSSIGFQVKPAQTTVNADKVIGGEISPRINSGIAGKGITGLHVDAYLKGTAAGTISENVTGLELEVYTDDAGTRTFSGNVSLLRLRSAFSATTITGKFVPIRVEVAETQTNSKNFDGLFELTGKSPLVWNDDPGTEVSGSIKGYIGLYVNGAKRYIALYDTAPTD